MMARNPHVMYDINGPPQSSHPMTVLGGGSDHSNGLDSVNYNNNGTTTINNNNNLQPSSRTIVHNMGSRHQQQRQPQRPQRDIIAPNHNKTDDDAATPGLGQSKQHGSTAELASFLMALKHQHVAPDDDLHNDNKNRKTNATKTNVTFETPTKTTTISNNTISNNNTSTTNNNSINKKNKRSNAIMTGFMDALPHHPHFSTHVPPSPTPSSTTSAVTAIMMHHRHRHMTANRQASPHNISLDGSDHSRSPANHNHAFSNHRQLQQQQQDKRRVGSPSMSPFRGKAGYPATVSVREGSPGARTTKELLMSPVSPSTCGSNINQRHRQQQQQQQQQQAGYRQVPTTISTAASFTSSSLSSPASSAPPSPATTPPSARRIVSTGLPDAAPGRRNQRQRKATPALVEDPAAARGPAMPASDIQWDGLLRDSDLVLPKDRDLVPDALFVAMAQMMPCDLTQADRVGCYKSRDIGFTGMCCRHCGGQPGFGRYFPNSVRSLAQTTTSQTILKHVGLKCRFCPPEIRQAILELQRQQAEKESAAAAAPAAASTAAGRPRYGSRKVFFQRIWSRLHAAREQQAAKINGSSLALLAPAPTPRAGATKSPTKSKGGKRTSKKSATSKRGAKRTMTDDVSSFSDSAPLSAVTTDQDTDSEDSSAMHAFSAATRATSGHYQRRQQPKQVPLTADHVTKRRKVMIS